VKEINLKVTADEDIYQDLGLFPSLFTFVIAFVDKHSD
jgi:hypothetical protein